jgi:hypothetical protein
LRIAETPLWRIAVNRQAISIAASALLLATTAAQEPNDMVARLKSGDTSVCADEGTIAAIPVIVDPEVYDRFVESGGKVPRAWAVSATGVNKDIAEVRCEASFDSAGVIQFTIRPSLDEPGGTIITVEHTPASESLSGWMSDHTVMKHATH